MAVPMKTVHVVIRGRVQGVGFRYHFRDMAVREGIDGWCRNRPDGSVEAVLSGVSGAVNAVLGWCEVGPPAARVEGVTVTDSAERPTGGFEIRP